MSIPDPAELRDSGPARAALPPSPGSPTLRSRRNPILAPGKIDHKFRPTLRADTQFLNLQKELVITEDRIQAARRFYNGNVRDCRNKCQSFPGNLVANAFRFKPEPFFEADPACRLAPVAGFATS